MKQKKLLMTVAIFTIVLSMSAQENGTVTDSRDGKVYKTVKIGTQTWMAENLAYKGGSIILPSVTYDNLESNVGIYGYLYDWETAKFVAPSGWHLPSEIEWKTLINFLGGDSLAGGKLKESGSTHWYNNTNATNESGFTGLPGGFCMPNGKFNFSNVAGFWWSSTEKSPTDAWFCNFAFNSSKITSGPINKSFKFAVRCIKDYSTSKPTTQAETNSIKIENKTSVVKGILYTSDDWVEYKKDALDRIIHKEKANVLVGVKWVTLTLGSSVTKYKLVSIQKDASNNIKIMLDLGLWYHTTISIIPSGNGYDIIKNDSVDNFLIQATMKNIDTIE